MAKVVVDLQKWVGELEDISAEEQASLLAILGKPKAKAKLDESFMRQSDYSRAMNEDAAARKKADEDLAAKDAALGQFEQALISWRDENTGKFNATEDELARERTQRQSLENNARALMVRFGIPEEEVTKLVSTTVGATNLNANPNNGQNGSPNVNTQTKNNDPDAAAAALATIPALNAELADIAADYQELYGKPLHGQRILLQEAIANYQKTGQSIRQFAEVKLKFADKRNEQFTAQRAMADQKLVRETEERVRSEMAASGGVSSLIQRDGIGSPILDRAAKGEFKVQTPDGDGGAAHENRGWMKAVQAWGAGKYKGGVEHTP